jgi:beta-glucosidase
LLKQGVAKSKGEAAALALNAGTDMAMTFPKDASPMLDLPEAIAAGKVDVARLDAAVQRVLEAKIRMGLFDRPYVDETDSARVLADPAHRDMARVAAERSAVLLVNERGTLPLQRDKLTSLAVIGPLADSAHDTLGPWVFPTAKPSAVTILAGLKAKLGSVVDVRYAEGVRIPERLNRSFFDTINRPPEREPLADGAFDSAVALARDADATVIVLGEAQNMSGEAASRSSLALPGRQQELLKAVIATGKPVVLVLMNGRPLDIGQVRPSAVLEAWYPGSDGGTAVANLLLGDAVPGGKLPFSWIGSAAQAPFSYSTLPSHAPESALKRYWDASGKPVFPFGFGLSYTTFAYGHLAVASDAVAAGKSIDIAFDLTNTGARAGEEVAQLYLHQRVGSSSRPSRELKTFTRVALAPGETRRITFTLTADDMRYWSAAKRAWVQESGVYDVYVGGDSEAKLAAHFTVR